MQNFDPVKSDERKDIPSGIAEKKAAEFSMRLEINELIINVLQINKVIPGLCRKLRTLGSFIFLLSLHIKKKQSHEY